jgi:Flp pilus assembly pilin Flp
MDMSKLVFEDERGASIVEYALLVALIFVVCVVAVTIVGDETGSSFSNTADAVSQAREGR